MQLQHQLLLLCLLAIAGVHAEYLVGVGKSDITGPAADVNLMGYAMPLQIARGIHIRLYARAYVFAQADNTRRRFVYVVSDACMSSQLVTLRVLQRLEAMYGGMYSRDNVVLSGTHTHASPAGFLQYVLYSVTSLGFMRQSFDALVDGITEAIAAAHGDVSPADVSYASGELLGANINRSPTAYLANPAAERALYSYDVDKTMELLRISYPHAYGPRPPSSGSSDLNDNGGNGRGLISWFPVHCTSMNNTNPFVSGDNKGAAAQFVEKAWQQQQQQQQETAAGQPSFHSSSPAGSSSSRLSWFLRYWQLIQLLLLRQKPKAVQGSEGTAAAASFVAAFAQSSVGDTSPNVQGAFCLDSGKPCEMSRSTCGGRNELCVGRGPAWPDDTASTAVIGHLQADKAQQLWREPGSEVSGPIDYRHTYINMSAVVVSPSQWTRAGVTCPPAMGFSFAAGTTDGPGAFDFTQADTNGTAFWRLVRDFLSAPTAEQQACHAPKPILLNTGYMNQPYPWQPHITELSVTRLGAFVIVAVPGEFSTMAGRRMRAAVADTIGDAWGPQLKVVLSGLSGTYSSYITTYEEYQVQRYEGASTLYGPHTLDAYIQTALQLVKAMLSGHSVSSDVTPPDLLSQQIELLGPVVMDAVPAAAAFGDVVVQPAATYTPGQTAEAVYRSGCPRNNLHRGGTFLEVQRQTVGGGWETVATDADWETHFYWERHWKLSAHSYATVRWAIPSTTAKGVYRLVHYGDAKPLLGRPSPFTGISRSFAVTAPPDLHIQMKITARTDAAANTPHNASRPLCHGADPTSMLVRPEPGGLHRGMLQEPQQPRATTQKQAPVQQNIGRTLDERWAALSGLYKPGVQWQTRFGCGQQYTPWWRHDEAS